MREVNLLSDTQTRPTRPMREAMAHARVGDEQRAEDPTVLTLQARVAKLLGHEAALFLPSGTMCNLIGFLLHVRRGDEVLLHAESHPIVAEAGGPAAIAGAMLRPLPGDGGMFDAVTLEAGLGGADRHAPRSRLVCVEQTTNLGGGRVWSHDALCEVLACARAHGLRAHLDGARLLNAVVASGLDAATWAAGFDTAWIDFSKGLGAPVGACLAGSAELMGEAWRYKQMLGGAMRQAGVLAAAAVYALEHHVERLVEDHANARLLARGLAELPGVQLDVDKVDTNIVVFEVADAAALCERLALEGVRAGALDAKRVRMVCHLDVDSEGVERALEALRQVLA